MCTTHHPMPRWGWIDYKPSDRSVNNGFSPHASMKTCGEPVCVDEN
jgi:hypothetical protein